MLGATCFAVEQRLSTALRAGCDMLRLSVITRRSLSAENLFLRQQLALFQERK